MTHAAARAIDALTPAWRELECRAPVKLCVIESERHYRGMIDFTNQLVDEIGDRKPRLMAQRFGVSPAVFI